MTARKTVRVPAPPPTVFRQVESVCASDIGRVIRFYEWDATREMATVTTAELRQISAMGESVTLTYGLLAERQYTFQFGELLVFEPQPDYSDVAQLRQEFCDFHGITEDLL